MQLSSAKMRRAVQNGLKFLHLGQLPSGEFPSYRSTDPSMKQDREFDSSPFPTALICFCLSFSESPMAEEMIRKAGEFFLAEMEGQGVWRYWTSRHPYHRNIPPDLDDIACVSSVLERSGVDVPDNRKLILANRNSQGLFYTWLVPRALFPLDRSYWSVVLREALKPVSLYYFWKQNESEPNDIDCIVNANVLFYLGDDEATGKPVADYLMGIVQSEKEACCDKWHLNRFTFYYTISRNYFHGMSSFERVRQTVIDRILCAAAADGMIGENVLDTALAVCSLQNWRADAGSFARSVEFLLAKQKQNGGWESIPLYYGGPKKYFGWGSEEITTAFCVEALVRFSKSGNA
jgi:hypothetical protein